MITEITIIILITLPYWDFVSLQLITYMYTFRELLLGLGSNRNISNVELNLSSMELQSQGIQNLQNSLSKLNNITSLNISNIGKSVIPRAREIEKCESVRQHSNDRLFPVELTERADCPNICFIRILDKP